jgi:hypothetical protein
MSTPSRKAKRGALPWGVIGMLSLVAACEQFCAGNEHDRSGAIPAGWRMAARAASGFMGDQGVVCFGDSQVKKGLMPAVLGERLGWPVFNLALTGGQPPSSYYLLRRTLAAGKRPEALVLNAYPGLLAADLRINIRQWPELLTFTETLELAWLSRDAKLVGFLALARLFPTLKTREEIRTTFRSALRGEPSRTRSEVLMKLRAWWLDRGAEPAEPNPRFADQAGERALPPQVPRACRRAGDSGLLAVAWAQPRLAGTARRAEAGRAIRAARARLAVGIHEPGCG